MQWFGQSWGAPVCDEKCHATTPVGKRCQGCEAAIEAGDRGLLIPFAGPGTASEEPWHLRCFMATLDVGSAAVSITCPRCQKTSYNPFDVLNRYCGNCRQFHDEGRFRQ